MRIRWTDPAVHDFTQICDYIQEHLRAATARRVALSIFRVSAYWRNSLNRDVQVASLKRGSSFLLGLPYLAVYRLSGDAVEILRICMALNSGHERRNS